MKWMFLAGCCLLMLTGCAQLIDAVKVGFGYVTVENVGEGLKQGAGWFSPPVSTVIYGVGAFLTGVPAAVVTHRKLKNSPEGKLFGPLKPKEA